MDPYSRSSLCDVTPGQRELVHDLLNITGVEIRELARGSQARDIQAPLLAERFLQSNGRRQFWCL